MARAIHISYLAIATFIITHATTIIDAFDAVYQTLATPGMSLNGRGRAAQTASFAVWLYGKAKDVAIVATDYAAGQTTFMQVAMTTTLVAFGIAAVAYLVKTNEA